MPHWKTSILLAVMTALLLPQAALAIPPQCDLDCPPENTAPSVTLSAAPMQAARGQSVTFTADASDDDGDPLESEWDLDGGFDYGEAANQLQVTRSFSTVGSHTVRVRVSDGFEQASHAVTIQVVNRAPTASFSRNPSSPKTNETVTFTSNSTDPDGDTIASRVWDLDNDNIFGEPGETGNSVSRSFPTAGSYPVKLMVTDSLGADSAVTTASVSVANRVPLAAFTVFPASALVGETVTFDSTPSSDPDGTVQSRGWDLDNDGDFDDGASVTATRSFPLPGTYTVRLRVTDNLFDTSVESKTVTVAAPAGQEPGSNSGGSSTTAAPPPDTVAPAWSFTAARKQRSAKSKAIAFKLKPNERCTLHATAMLGKKRLGVLKKALAANVLSAQKLKLSRKGLAALKKTLRGKRTVTISLVMSCVDGAGNARKLTRKVKITR